MIGWLQAQMWKLGTLGASAVALCLGVALALSAAQKHQMEGDRAKLDAAINNPQTGYVVRLAQCRANVTDLEQSIEQQNARISAVEAGSAQRIATAETAVQRAREATRAANTRVTAILSAAPKGATVCERVEDVDRRFLEMLK